MWTAIFPSSIGRESYGADGFGVERGRGGGGGGVSGPWPERIVFRAKVCGSPCRTLTSAGGYKITRKIKK